ncbi:three-Cys-motif partner protein TcmP [Bordetella hinzii]|uniref:three-Cys-motif partner protein TcmP n=1 Tax=Bordetella hinzii TaxID=103855 RepID=UPI0009B8ED73|nr:three-Cys-motif partner protein TcmP [Bordetella hinzii]
MMPNIEAVDADDGLPVMAVGAWAFEKHALIRRYVGASRETRRKWPKRVLVDLFCGPGRVVDRTRPREVRDGGVVVAFSQSVQDGAPFSKVIIGDTDPIALDACKHRLEALGASVMTTCAPAVESAPWALQHLPGNGLHLALLDPFNIGHLPFSVIQALAKRAHLDMIIHYSLMDVARNIEMNFVRNAPTFDAFAPGWKAAINVRNLTKADARRKFGEHWQSLIRDCGYDIAELRPTMSLPGTKNHLYQMLLLHRHPLAEHLWNEIAKPPQNAFVF